MPPQISGKEFWIGIFLTNQSWIQSNLISSTFQKIISKFCSFQLIMLLFYRFFFTKHWRLYQYLAIVSSLNPLPFIKGRERTSPKWAIRGGTQKEAVAQKWGNENISFIEKYNIIIFRTSGMSQWTSPSDFWKIIKLGERIKVFL